MLGTLFSIGAIQILIMVVLLARSKALSLLLGPAGFGVVATIDQTVTTVVSLSALSLPFTGMKFMAHSHSLGPDRFQRTFSSFLRALSILALAAVLVMTALLAAWPQVLGADLVRYRPYLAVAILGVPALSLSMLFVNTLAAGQATRASAWLNFGFTAALAAAAVGGAWADGIGGLYATSVSIGVVATVLAFACVHRRLGLKVFARGSSLVRELREDPTIVTYSVMLYLTLVAHSFTLLWARYAVLSRFGETEAGLLQAHLGIALTVGAVAAPMTNLYLIPLVNRAAPVHEKARAVDRFATKLPILTLLGALPFVLFPSFAIGTLYSREFLAGAQLLGLFVLWQCLQQIVSVYLHLLIGLDDVRWVALVTCGSYACSWALISLLLPSFGRAAVALALIAAMVLWGGAIAVRLSLKFGVSIPLRTWVRVAGSLAILATGGVLFSSAAESSLVGIAQRAAFVLAAVAVIALDMTSEEKRELWSFVTRRATRT